MDRLRGLNVKGRCDHERLIYLLITIAMEYLATVLFIVTNLLVECLAIVNGGKH